MDSGGLPANRREGGLLMYAQKKAALRGGGENKSSAPQSYPRSPLSASAQLGAWLSPRRKLYAERLLAHLTWHGRKVYFDDRAYGDVHGDDGLDRFAVNQAIDDLYALGLVDVQMAA